QGGLGMFQFDAGTYDDTLRREGDRILSIAGNVQAAVDFVANMVIRSAYVPGVDTRAQAIEWMNGVRIGNDRWDPWIRTVTHYYNGCAPSYSCFSSRYAHYRDNTSGVFDEMGADFWSVQTDWAAEYVAQSFPLASQPFPLEAGSTSVGYLEVRNAGARTVKLNRPVAPEATGEHSQYFNLVREGVAWFSDSGGPPDRWIQLRVESQPRTTPSCPAGIGAEWTCEGDNRARCEAGIVTREPCALGCVAGLCETTPSDSDGDGAPDTSDCAPSDPSVFPGASELCDDGVDQDCDGADAPCLVIETDAALPGTDGGVGRAREPRLVGTCAVGPREGRGGAPWYLLLMLSRSPRGAARP
ncbi:MAG: putative metal-binding motif-containing protein, partial [Sandaracinaceae bacterium]|nr:putative metal-binding motif-containing protein [Sandaracinaceae bacterium]